MTASLKTSPVPNASSLTVSPPGDLGTLLAKFGYTASLTITRADGASLSDFDRESIGDVCAAVTERDEKSAGALSDYVFIRRATRGDERERAEKAARRPSKLPKGKRAAAKRPRR